MPVRITTYRQAFNLINVPCGKKELATLRELERRGYTEKSISFSMWRERDRLIKHRNDENFLDILIEVVEKWSWLKDDPRWEAYNKKKAETQKAKAAQAIIKKQRAAATLQGFSYDNYPGYVYFIQGVNGGPIKTGYATNIENRLKTLQTGYPDVLTLLLAIPGDIEREHDIQKEFKRYKLKGEWFSPDPELLKGIEKWRLHYTRKKFLDDYCTGKNGKTTS